MFLGRSQEKVFCFSDINFIALLWWKGVPRIPTIQMDAAVRNRLILSLRSEEAMGLSSVQLKAPQPSSVAVESTLFTEPPPRSTDEPALPTEQKQSELAAMNAQEVSVCKKCRLCETRTQTVFGEGDPNAKIFFIGEGPGENEDLTGRPFVGRAGQLLDKMIVAMGLTREQVYIANIVKCRPPQNRTPAPDEVATCTPYLERQLNIVRPRVIVTLGRPATAYMLNDPKLTMGRARGHWHQWRGIKLMPTFHPSYVLRSYTPETRRAVWSDLQQVIAEIGLPVGRRGTAP